MMTSKKAQVWYADFSVALLIFVVAITGFLAYNYAGSVEQKGELTELMIDAKVISSALISEGYPADWNLTNVTILGLTDGHYRIVQSKLDMFNSMDYDDRADLMGTTKEYYFYLEHQNGTKFNELGVNGTDADKLVQVTRILIYNQTFVRMVLHLWQP